MTRANLITAYVQFMAHHWQQHATLAECWDLAQLPPGPTRLGGPDAAADLAQMAWGVRAGTLRHRHWLVPCVAAYALQAQALVQAGAELPSGADLVAAIRAERDRPRRAARTGPAATWGPGGKRERWS